MVKIRLNRTGRKKNPSYRIVVATAEAKRDGRFIEIIGSYNPVGKKTIDIKKDRYEHWLSQGAQPTKRVEKLFEQIK